MQMKGKGLSIWFLIGLQLDIYGVLTAGSGIYQWAAPPQNPTILADLHAGVWWGVIMLALGLFYTIMFRPRGKIGK
jgi:hypothetical protein